MPVLSVMKPKIRGSIAPPTIDITIKLLAISVSDPKFFMPSENIVGNMIDIKKQIPINA